MSEEDILEHAQMLGFDVWYTTHKHLSIADKLKAFHIGYEEDAPVQFNFALLKHAFSLFVGKRVKLPICQIVDQFVHLICNSQNILVLSGAGVIFSSSFRCFNFVWYPRLSQ